MPLTKRRLSQLFSPATMRAAKRVKMMRSKGVGKAKRMRANFKRALVSTSRNVHKFKRYANDTRQNCTGTTFPFAIEYKFDDIRGSTEFTGLYDRYMITAVVHKFRLVNNPDAVGAPVTTEPFVSTSGWNRANLYPKLWYCKDYDDAAAESLTSLQERAKTKCMVLQPNKQYTIVVRPAVTVQTYRTQTTTGYAPKWKQWIDMAQTDVPHYGLKCVIDTSAQDPVDTQPFIVEYTTQYYFTCKDVR